MKNIENGFQHDMDKSYFEGEQSEAKNFRRNVLTSNNGDKDYKTLAKKKKHLKKVPKEKTTFLAKKKALSKHYFINKKQQESTCN